MPNRKPHRDMILRVRPGESLDAVANTLTKNRVGLLSALKHNKPSSVRGLSRMLKRDPKHVKTDIEVLKATDLVKLKKGAVPALNFDTLRIVIEL